MHRVTLLRNIKKIKTCPVALSSCWFNRNVWFHGWSKDNFSTHAGEHDDIKMSASHFSLLPLKELALGYKPRIAGRPYLPGSSSGGLPEFLPGSTEGSSFPMAYKVKNPQQYDVKGWSHVCRQLVDEELAVHGAILIR